MRLACLNCENLFLNSVNNIFGYLKSKAKSKELARAITEFEADIIFLSEVGGEDSLEIFCRDYLLNVYDYSILKGNSDRGIELAYLIKKESKIIFTQISHKERPLYLKFPEEKNVVHKMSRDIAELQVFDSIDSQKSNSPKLIILGVHLKSHWDRKGLDPAGRKKRKAELGLLLQVFKKRQAEYKSKIPVLLCGDFNGHLSGPDEGEEFQDLRDNPDLVDLFDLLNLPHSQRTTFVAYNRDKEFLGLAMDYWIIPKSFEQDVDKKNSGIFRYTDLAKRQIPLPQTRGAKNDLPSDHYPVLLELKNI